MQLDLLLPEEKAFDTVTDVIRSLAGPCLSCRLAVLHPNNRGILYRGNPNARIAVLDETPGDTETNQGKPLVGHSGQEFEKWMRYLALDSRNDVFITHVVQCQPPRKKGKDGKYEQMEPHRDELNACWYPRTLRVLKAMPNLECIITLGFVSARAVLGGDPKSKSHEGRWFTSTLFPGVPVFCLTHPENMLAEPSPEKKGKLVHCLDCFRREYVQTRKVVAMAQHTTIPVQ